MMKANRPAPPFSLRTQAERLAELLPRQRLHPQVLKWAETSSRAARWSVAFSGGADSLALLLLVWAHWPDRRSRLRALHFNHRLRGAAATADAAFCRRMCAELGVELVEGEWQRRQKNASEAEARAARLAFFELHSRALWLGHQQDDVAETLLMRLARGSGSAGLAAPRPVNPMPGRRMHLRPLLGLKKSEVVTALREAELEWREDASNAGGDYFRNRVRHSVVPAWSQASGRDALAGAALSRELLEEDDAALEQWLAELKPTTNSGDLDLRKLKGRPKALIRRALRQWLSSQRGVAELAKQGFDRLLAAVMAGLDTRQSLGATIFAVINAQELKVERVSIISRKAVRRFPRPAN